jgi:hypothetical protein
MHHPFHRPHATAPLADRLAFAMGGRWSAAPTAALDPHIAGGAALDRAFIALQTAYRERAGLARLHHLSAGGRVLCEGKWCAAEHLLATGELFGLPWNNTTWIPLFQFAWPGPTVAPAPKRVVAELGPRFGGWALARWFVQPHARLADDCPIDRLSCDLSPVLAAARADRIERLD